MERLFCYNTLKLLKNFNVFREVSLAGDSSFKS